jgi:hypothetical protein
MSKNSIPSNTFNKDHLEVVLPAFRGLDAVSINMVALKEAERRLIEAKTVTPSTYTELEYVMGEAYREIKKNLATVGYQILKTENELERSKASALLDRYPAFLEGKPAKFDNAAIRDAFLARDTEVQEAKERLDSLKTLQVFLEGRVKVMENVCHYMRNAMRLVMKSGVPTDIYYNNKSNTGEENG